MASKDSYHVVPKNTGGWDVKRSNSARATSHHELKSDAINEARVRSQVTKSELIIHGKDGKIQSRDSHGHDPFPPKG